MSVTERNKALTRACVDVDCDVTLLDLASGATAAIARAGNGPPIQAVLVPGGGDLIALTAIEEGGHPNDPSASQD